VQNRLFGLNTSDAAIGKTPAHYKGIFLYIVAMKKPHDFHGALGYG